MNRFLIILLLIAKACFLQARGDSIPSHTVFYANRLSSHPLGILTSRTNHCFQTEPSKKISLCINMSSGNVWLPFVKSYQPLNESDREIMQSHVWNDRDYYYDQENSPSKTMEFHADGIIRLYQINLDIPLNNYHELKINTRAFSLDEGNVPYSLLTSDQFIEWFHSNIHGGEDPFARKAYGLNQAGINYVDENGESIEIEKGQFTWSGIDFVYNYYPVIKGLNTRGIYTSFGMQLGVNTSHFNPSMDLGINSSLVKKIQFRNRRELRLGVSLSAYYQNLARFGDGVQLRNNKLLFNSEFLLNYIIPTKRAGYFSLACTYFIQSPYNKQEDFDTLVLTGDRISTHWHYSISHLYKVLSANCLVLSYSIKAVAFSIFLREDFSVDNAPDAQVGAGMSFHFK